MDIQAIASSYLGAYDTFAQVLATLYIAIAIFSGEQVSTAFKSQQPQIRVNPRRYIAYLHLWQASGLLLLLTLIGAVYGADIFSSIEAPLAKAAMGIVLQTAVIAALFWTIYDTLVHSRIEKKFGEVTGSVSRLIAWVLREETNKAERLKLAAVLLERTNDVDLERLVLEDITRSVQDTIKHPAKHKDTYKELLSMLRTLRTSLDKRPLEDPQYYNSLFIAVHYRWAEAFEKRTALHGHGIMQLSSTLAGIAKELEAVSVKSDLSYDFFVQIKAFLEGNPAIGQAYFDRIGSAMLADICTSPHRDIIWNDYIRSWRVDYSKPLSKQPVATQALYRQYLGMVHTSLRLDSSVTVDPGTDLATEQLFPGIDTMAWAVLVTLHDHVRQHGAGTKALYAWLSHPRKFGFGTVIGMGYYSDDEDTRAQQIEHSFAEARTRALQLAAHTQLFTQQETTRLLAATAKVQQFKNIIYTTDGQPAAQRLTELEMLLQGLKQQLH